MKHNKMTKIYSILLLISIFITGLSNGAVFAEKNSQDNYIETCNTKYITGDEIFKNLNMLSSTFLGKYLRGDPYFFNDLKRMLKDVKFSSYDEFENLFNEKFEQITNRKVYVVEDNLNDWIYVEKYAPKYTSVEEALGGKISEGCLLPRFWFEVFLPFVKNTFFDKFNYIDKQNNINQNLKQIKISVNNIYFLLDPKNKTAIVLGGSQNTKRDGEIIIPAFIKYNETTYRVTEIAKEAFFGNWDLCKIIFEGHINKIGDSAFDKTNLNFIDMHKGVDYFGKDVFLRIPSYAKFIVPKGKEKDYANKLKKSLKGIEHHFTYDGEEDYEYDLFIGANSKHIG